jgi:GT2 family glycosyltransferase|tara:strand:+ start:4564 stop:5409 length:846 start_codon:yes stop_codon:yes gene_type:complete
MSIRDITAVIASFKSGEIIKSCLNSINRECKVILVENSNDLDFKRKIEQEFSNVECILSGNNLGYGKANNIGLKKVTSKYALILNPDTTLQPDSIENFFKAIKRVPKFSIMAPLIQEKKEEATKINRIDNNPISVKNVKGFAMFLNISEFQQIGFFDENFFFYFEEIDLCKRLIDNHKKIYLVPSIKINHAGGKSHDKTLNKEMELSRNWHWMWSTFYYNKKYKGFLISFLIILPKLSSAVFKVILYSFFLNRDKREIYNKRCSGLINAITGKDSWYRPKV